MMTTMILPFEQREERRLDPPSAGKLDRRPLSSWSLDERLLNEERRDVGGLLCDAVALHPQQRRGPNSSGLFLLLKAGRFLQRHRQRLGGET